MRIYKPLTDDIKKKMSDSANKRWSNPEERLKASLSQKGKKFSEEYKENMRKTMIGRKVTWGKKISKSKTGFKYTEESKEKMRLSHLGHKKAENGYSFPIGETHPNWNGGRYKTGTGYIMSYCKNHPYAIKNGSYVLEHRLIMEKHLGRFLKPSEVVHHINKILDDNRIENLELFESQAKHLNNHALRRKVNANFD